MDTETTLTCSVNIEWLNTQGTTLRKQNYKTAILRLIRNEFQIMHLEITADKIAPVRLKFAGVNVYNKFANEGKASIKFQEARCAVFMNNAPPNQLLGFLRTIFFKMTGSKSSAANTSLRTQLLSNKPKTFEEISPVTIKDVNEVKEKITRTTDTTPSPSSRKRKLNERDSSNKPSSSKKLYSMSVEETQPLTEEQQEVLNACLAGHNVFFTGSAGTGKSFLLKRIIASLPPDVTIATASTGVAACHIGGITLHQFAGIGKGDATLERSCKLASNPSQAQLWRRCKHLIIDEISMVDGDFFEKIEAVARYVRKSDKCFGGIQLILCGDFLQLPPVSKRKENNFKNTSIRFAFQTTAWEQCIQVCFELNQVHRQSDADFIDILNKIRLGRVSDDIANKLMSTSKQKIEEGGILATRLCSHTDEANVINESKLSQLSGESKIYDAEDSDSMASKQLDVLTPIASKIVLKMGAQVMLLKNINLSTGLVNGARGVLIGFSENLPVVRFRNQEYQVKPESWSIKTASGATLTRKQLPLRLAWAFSIHKSQGLTLDCVEMSLAKVFEAGQAYVALSRAQSLKRLRVLNFKSSQVWANSEVLQFYDQFKRKLEYTRIIPLGVGKLKKSFSEDKKFKSKPKGLNQKIISKPLVNIS